MKIVLSRKGFDSSIGRCASPILPNGELLSLPIPTWDKTRYKDLYTSSGVSYCELIRQLGCGRHIQGKGAHLDPDLIPRLRKRALGWLASFGQIGAAAGHLRNQQVQAGDLFLFYGWFRQTELVDDRLRYVPSAPDLHVIFGYLQIGQILPAQDCRMLPSWLQDHPHLEPARLQKSTNTLYIAASHLTALPHLPGAGIFRFNETLILTAPGMTRGKWALPDELRGRYISYHTPGSWRSGYFQSYPRAQEYVVHADADSEAWALTLIRSGLNGQ